MQKFRPWLSWALALLVAGLIFYGSTRTTGAAPVVHRLRGLLVPLLGAARQGHRDWASFLIQKTGHVLEYMALAWVLALAFGARPRASWWAWTVSVLFAVSDEWHQSFVPHREPTLRDVLIDAAAAGAFLLLRHWHRRRHGT